MNQRTKLPLGHFEVNKLAELGRGGMGVVHKGIIIDSNVSHLHVNTFVAVKTLGERWKDSPDHIRRFGAEIGLVRNFDHPHIVAYVGEDPSSTGKRHYFMELYECNLREYMDRNRMSLLDKMVLIDQVADGLQHAHDKNVYHRDIKPENILMDGNKAVITDFGLGKEIHKESVLFDVQGHTRWGTDYYISMKQWLGTQCGPCNDVFSLGMMMGEMVYGQRPLGADWKTGINIDVLTPSVDAYHKINQLVRHMTNPDWRYRIESMRAVRAELFGIKNKLRGTRLYLKPLP